MPLLHSRAVGEYIPSSSHIPMEGLDPTTKVSTLNLYRLIEPEEAPIFLQPQVSITGLDIQILIGELENLYIFENPREIKKFILNNEYLIDILFEAPLHIYRIFEHVPTFLELHHDPEEDWDELFIVIRSSYLTDEAIRRENQLVEEWFLERMDDTQGRLNIVEESL